MEGFVFSVCKEDVLYWIASLPFAENFLRKKMFGVEWIPLQTMGGGGSRLVRIEIDGDIT